jgi:hypothetical protein
MVQKPLSYLFCSCCSPIRVAFFDEPKESPMSFLSTLKKIAKAAPAVLTALPTIVSTVKEVKGAIKNHPKPSAATTVEPGPGGSAPANPTG